MLSHQLVPTSVQLVKAYYFWRGENSTHTGEGFPGFGPHPPPFDTPL